MSPQTPAAREGAWTKGPWRVEVGSSWCNVESDSGAVTIAEGCDELDARLIAAAPDLAFEAAQSAATLTGLAVVLRGNGLSGYADVCDWQATRCNAALARARGDAPAGGARE